MKRRRFGERSGYIVIVSAFLIMLNVVLGVFMINRSQKAIIIQIEGRMLDITNTAADMLNGDKLKNGILTYADTWVKAGLASKGFADWLRDSSQVSFPLSMIDKITPRPDSKVQQMLNIKEKIKKSDATDALAIAMCIGLINKQ